MNPPGEDDRALPAPASLTKNPSRFDNVPNQTIPLLKKGFDLVLKKSRHNLGSWQKNLWKHIR